MIGRSVAGACVLKSRADSSHPLAGPRLKDFISSTLEVQDSTSPHSSPSFKEMLDSIHHFNVPTLPHLLALLVHAHASFPPPRTSLIVVDSVSSLFALAFPKFTEKLRQKDDAGKKQDLAQWAASRRWAVMSDFISKTGKLAASTDITILLISQATTRVKANSDTILHPAVSGSAWDNGVHTRLVLFRDWLPKRKERSSQGLYVSKARFIGIVKGAGITHDGLEKVVPFVINQVEHMPSPISIAKS